MTLEESVTTPPPMDDTAVGPKETSKEMVTTTSHEDSDVSSDNNNNNKKNNNKNNNNANTVKATTTTTTMASEIERQRSQRPGVIKALSVLEGELLKETGTVQFTIPSNQQANNTASNKHGFGSLQCRVIRFIHRSDVQLFFNILLLMDVLILFAELALLSFFPPCEVIAREGISCCPPLEGGEKDKDHALRFLEKGGHEICEEGEPNFDYEAGCDEESLEMIHNIEHALFVITIAILCAFMLELLILVWALGPKVFFRQFFYVLDIFIVSVSLTLELLFNALGEEVFTNVGGLLIILRLWRFIRIGHGIIEVTVELARSKFFVLIEYTRELELLLQKNSIDVPDTKLAMEAHELQEEALSAHHDNNNGHNKNNDNDNNTNKN